MKFSNRILSLLKYYNKAKTIYNIHSPTLFDFCSKCLIDHRRYYAFDNIEFLIDKIYQSKEEISLKDYGAGSRYTDSKKRSITSILKQSSSNQAKGQILYKTAKHLNAKNILELGTNLGIGSLYLAMASNDSHLSTIEGDQSLYWLAIRHAEMLKVKNIKFHQGVFNEILPGILKNSDPFDLIFVDGHHDYLATLHYFKMIHPHLTNKSVIIFDDIHWSIGMEKAWEEIKEMNLHSHSIDNYKMGIMFFGFDAQKIQNISFVKYKYKPWKIGLTGN